MDMTELNKKINLFFQNFKKNVTFITNFVIGRLKNFKNITLTEQISYPTIAVGLVLLLVSIILFIV